MDWSADLIKLASKGGRDIGELCKAVKVEMFSEIASLTRVGNPDFWKGKAPRGYVGGRLRGNWQIQENTMPSGELERIDKTGDKVVSEVESMASEDGVTYFVNNIPYAEVWEENDMMVGSAVARLDSIIKEEARKL